MKPNFATYARTQHSNPTDSSPADRAQRTALDKSQLADELASTREALINQLETDCDFARRTTILDDDQIIAAITIVKARIAARG